MESDILEMLTTSQVARRLRLSSARIVQLRVEGRLRGIKTPLGFLYPADAVADLERQRENKKKEE